MLILPEKIGGFLSIQVGEQSGSAANFSLIAELGGHHCSTQLSRFIECHGIASSATGNLERDLMIAVVPWAETNS